MYLLALENEFFMGQLVLLKNVGVDCLWEAGVRLAPAVVAI
jgi:hypothetical protein